ncbi:hypothetical protein KJ934_00320 [Patescibacteria group bacterium]|nr:hypothetical protein [Patescibacteria group bacterium]MBU4353383.1 hypothetical protein [Patescibacteria group bacterium]MBU4477461.1 hypothetical protein [Patescibacteria group bacterium]MCG2699129.1 hypothetical protein [Candidatus Parcubacteria bacterium]
MENTEKTVQYFNFKKQFDDLKKRWTSTPAPKKDLIFKQKNNMQNTEKPQGQAKICPFMSTPDKDRVCSPNCKLYRANNRNFECTFFAIQSISWNMKNGNNSGDRPRY